jgi:hypothetical protein
MDLSLKHPIFGRNQWNHSQSHMQEALGCKSLLMKEGKKQNIWKKMHCHLSKVGEMNLLSLATLNMNSCVV